MKRLLTAVIAGTIFYALMSPTPVSAEGGVFLDDFLVTNNKEVVFYDNFDDGNIRDWQISWKSASIMCDRPEGPPCSLHINRHGGQVAGAYHTLKVEEAGLLEINARIFLTPANEQNSWRENRSANVGFEVESDSGGRCIIGGLDLSPKQTSYHALIYWSYPKGEKHANYTGRSKKPVLGPLKWADMTLRLDNKSGTATVYVNNKVQAVCTYDPGRFRSIGRVGIYCWLGDGAEAGKKE